MCLVAEDRPAALGREPDQTLAERQPRVEEPVGPAALRDERLELSQFRLGLRDEDAGNRDKMANRLDEPLEHLVELVAREQIVVDLGELAVGGGDERTPLGRRSIRHGCRHESSEPMIVPLVPAGVPRMRDQG